MRVVVAGSSGLIGTSLVPALRQARHEVIRLVRRPPAAPDERGWDPAGGHLDADALEGADAVVNLCGAGLGDKRWSQDRKQVLLDSRIRPTSVLARAAAERKVPALINGSAVGYYGNTGSQVITESSGSGSGFLADLCRQWEAATAPAADAGVRVVLLRTGIVLSPSGGLLGQLKPLFACLLGGRLGHGGQYVPWISLDDEAAAIRFVVEHTEVSGPVNLTGPVPVTNTEFTRALGHAMGRPAPWVVPGFVLRAVLGQLADEGALAGQRVLPTVLEDHGFTFQHRSVGAALAAAVGA
jgi:uncharacterized protein